MATHCSQEECGFGIYRGVLVQWDEDHDERILQFIDELPDAIREHLVIAQEHEACLALVWRNVVPPDYAKNSHSVMVGGDVWEIVESRVVGS